MSAATLNARRNMEAHRAVMRLRNRVNAVFWAVAFALAAWAIGCRLIELTR